MKSLKKKTTKNIPCERVLATLVNIRTKKLFLLIAVVVFVLLSSSTWYLTSCSKEEETSIVSNNINHDDDYQKNLPTVLANQMEGEISNQNLLNDITKVSLIGYIATQKGGCPP